MKIAILGNGAWGSALGEMIRRRGLNPVIWGIFPGSGDEADLKKAVNSADMVILVIPSHAMREVCLQLKGQLKPGVILVSAAKGIEEKTDFRMSEIIQTTTGRNEIAVLSGPTFAADIQKGIPSAVVVAAEQEGISKKVQETLNGEDFRIYTSRDVAGVEIGGALKNVMAIATGACAGLGFGDNSRAALITRGIAELSRVGCELGGNFQTFFGLSGMGDMILTCSSRQSRNFQVGESIGKGERLSDILVNLKGTAEGVKTAKAVFEILEKRKLDAPIMREVYLVLHEGKSVYEAFRALMSREPKPEFPFSK